MRRMLPTAAVIREGKEGRYRSSECLEYMCELADHSWCFKTPTGGVDRPVEDSLVEGGGSRDITGWKLDVVDLAVPPIHVGLIHLKLLPGCTHEY